MNIAQLQGSDLIDFEQLQADGHLGVVREDRPTLSKAGWEKQASLGQRAIDQDTQQQGARSPTISFAITRRRAASLVKIST